MNPTILGVLGPGFLNQVPTLTVQRDRKGQFKLSFLGASTPKLI